MKLSKFSVTVGDHDLLCLLAAPDQLTQVGARRALLLSFSTTRYMSLQTAPYDITAKAFTEAGHYVVSFDLPNHGDGIDEYGEGLVGLWRAHAAGPIHSGASLDKGAR